MATYAAGLVFDSTVDTSFAFSGTYYTVPAGKYFRGTFVITATSGVQSLSINGSNTSFSVTTQFFGTDASQILATMWWGPGTVFSASSGNASGRVIGALFRNITP